MVFMENKQISMDGEQYLNDFLVDGENFFSESAFHLERTIGTKANASIDPTIVPLEGDFIDFIDETHQQFKPLDTKVMCAPTDINITKQVIGKKGYGFIKVTVDANVDFIWHDRNTNTIHITGQYANCELAQRMISKRIAFYVRKMRRENKPIVTNRWDQPSPIIIAA